MKITTRQAAEKLGVVPTTVADMVRRGLLRDLNHEKNGRHALALSSMEVNAFKKTYKKRAHNHAAAPEPTLLLKVPSLGMQMSTRLARIEAKVDMLIKLWS